MKRTLLLTALCILVAPACATYTTNFHSAGTPENEPHERRTVVDAAGGAENFDLDKQCPNGWATLTIEEQVGKATAERWRCRSVEHAEIASPSPSPVP